MTKYFISPAPFLMKNLDSVNHKTSPPAQGGIGGLRAPSQDQLNLLVVKQKNSGRKILKKILLAIIIIIAVLGAVAALRAANLSQKIFVGQKTTFFGKIVNLIRGGGDNQKLIGENLGQINLLLLGIGGEGHDGPYLTDTMILAEIRPDIGEVALISIPRDYLVNLPDNLGEQKINAAFAYGFGKNKDYDDAGRWARQAVENISGLQIPYFAVLDFSGFKRAINQVGGLDVHVDRAFTDTTFPNDTTYGYLSPITFNEGDQRMDGTRALQFARSRHAEGLEGSDFARSLRQQKIIQAFKEKTLKLNLVSNAGTINSLLSTFAGHFHTNMSPAGLLRVYNLAKQKDIKTFISLNLDLSNSLVCPDILPDTGAYVLVPCPDKTAADIQNFFKNSFTFGKITAEKSVVWLSASGGDRAAYDQASNKLKQAGLTVWELPYKGQAPARNIFYQANPKPASAEFIKNTLNATEAALPPPGVKVDKTKVDVIVILGGVTSLSSP